MSYAYEPGPKPTWWKELTEKEQIEWYNGYIKALKNVIIYGSDSVNIDLEQARRELFLLSGNYERGSDKKISLLDVITDVSRNIVRYKKEEEE
tara:strand:+ start:1527 stop:1805 length:279 start_codon:yes stop_codon:yes gene_type:complete